jgi:hypothetical protein
VTRINWNKLSKQDQLSRSAAAQVRFESDNARDILVPGREGSYSTRTRYPMTCTCGHEMLEGERAWYYPNGPREQKVLCEACGLTDSHGRVRSWKDRS